MTNEELQEIINNPNGISAEDLDRVWEDMKARDNGSVKLINIF